MNISLDDSGQVEKIKKDTLLFKEGDLPENFFIVLSGTVSCFKEYNDRLVPVYSAGEKDLVGEDCLFSDSNKYYYSAIALEDVEVIRITKSEVFKFLNLHKAWVKNILQNISHKIQHTTELIAEHRILDDRLMAGEDFTDDDEAYFKKIIR
jgi:CRP/FNR family cyclic AMP-dependent transcriptional regulator